MNSHLGEGSFPPGTRSLVPFAPDGESEEMHGKKLSALGLHASDSSLQTTSVGPCYWHSLTDLLYERPVLYACYFVSSLQTFVVFIIVLLFPFHG